MTRTWLVPDSEDNTYMKVSYRRPDSEKRLERRRQRALDEQELQETINSSDPEVRYLYEKSIRDRSTAKRLAKDPKFWNMRFSEIMSYVQHNLSNHDEKPLMLRKNKSNSEEFSAHKALSDIRSKHYMSVKERRLNQNIERGDMKVKVFDKDFIDAVVRMRNKMGLTQAQLANKVNVTPGDIKNFENGTLMYNGALCSNLIWKLGLN